MSIIEELYNGELCPAEHMASSAPDYRQICRQIGEDREYFESILSENDRERFEKWNALIIEYEKITEFENFSKGFKIGMKLGCEVFGREDAGEGFEDKKKEIEAMIFAER